MIYILHPVLQRVGIVVIAFFTVLNELCHEGAHGRRVFIMVAARADGKIKPIQISILCELQVGIRLLSGLPLTWERITII